MKKLIMITIAYLALMSCKKDAEPLTLRNSVEITYGQTEPLNASHQCTYNSLDTIVASVSSAGLITAHRIGTTKVTATSNETGERAECTVTVTPRSNLYKLPIAVRYELEYTVKALETRELIAGGNGILVYAGENAKVRKVMYQFEQLELKSIDVMLQNTITVENEAMQFLEERYTYLGEIDYKAFAFSEGDMILVLNTDASLGLNVLYFWSDGKSAINYKKYMN